MTRILIVGSKGLLEKTVEVLYDLESVHLVDFPPDEEGFTLGSPLPAASDASHKLLRLRSVEKDLGIEDVKRPEPVPLEAVVRDVDRAIDTLQLEIADLVESKGKIQQRLGELEQHERDLEPLAVLPLDLELYRGYRSLAVFVGTYRTDPEGVLRESLDQFEMFEVEEERLIALFVSRDEADEAQRILIQHGFCEIAVPAGSGQPSEILRKLGEEEARLVESLEEVTEKLGKLKEKHSAFTLASDEHLSIIVMKAETPLRAGATAHSFILEAWIPSADLDGLRKVFAERAGEGVFVEVLEEKTRKAEGNEEEEVPVKADNPRPVGLFEYFVELISIPKYNEIDPTAFVSIVFPIFFGLMVGDVGYGIPFLILGYLGLKKVKSKEWRAIATMLFFGGIFTILFGLFFFGEAFGMHFAPKEHELTWSSLLGVELPHAIDLGAISIPLGMFSKLHDVKILLYISIWIGIVHLFIGFGLGFFNVAMKHGIKHSVLEKFSWLLILAGGVLLLLELIDVLILGKAMDLMGLRMLGSVGLLVAGIGIGVRGEGGRIILELPGLISNIVSYARLAAIGMAKAGMALAFNSIAIEMIAPGGGIMILFAVLVFIVGHLLIFVLAIISAGLHGIRLQYVEFFTKFFEGGGLKFDPLKVERKYTEV